MQAEWQQQFERKLLDDMERSCSEQNFQEGQVIIDYGKPIRMMPMVLSGTIRVMKQDDEGREILMYYLTGSESCSMAYSCCMEARLSEVKAIAEDQVKIWMIPHAKLDEWLCQYPSWKSYIMRSFNERFLEMLKAFENVAFNRLDERLVHYLKEKQQLGKSSVIPVSHARIAEDLATSRVVISRLLKKLEDEKKLILYRNEIKLLSSF